MWTLQNFGNHTGAPLSSMSIVDMPGVGLNFVSGSLPAFNNSAGVTYDIRYRVAGSSAWRTYTTGVNASAPFTFSLPQNGSIHYTEIRFDFGPVPVNFAQGNTITLNFVAGNNAPNNMLVNHFIVMRGGNETPGQSPYTPIVVPPPTPGSGNNLIPNGNGNGYIELDDNDVPLGEWIWRDSNGWVFIELPDTNIPLGFLPQTGIMDHALWLAAALFIAMSASLGTLSYMKAKKRKRGGNA